MAKKTKCPRPYALLVGFNEEGNHSFTCSMSETGKFYGAGGREVFPSAWAYAPIDDVMRMQGDDDGAWHLIQIKPSIGGHGKTS